MTDDAPLTNDVDYREKYCIIGAGSSGITAAKNLKQVGIPYDVIEREDDIGGNWYYGKPHSSVYRSTHLDSSKPLTQYTDFPIPREYPDYPNHEQILAYFKAYVQHFDLERDIHFNTSVERIAPAGDYWDVQLSNGEIRCYRGVIIANGHNWHPKYPEYPGEFRGMKLHSSDYKTPDVLEGKRVLVIGAGNSGCDIAAESATHAIKTFHSTRRGYYYLPKFFRGRPVDQLSEIMLKLHMPLSVRRLTAKLLYRMAVGDLSRFGVRKPDHKLFETHPIVNSLLPYHLGQGDIIPKPNVQEYCGGRVAFVDSTSEQIDLIIYATGFLIVFPFMDASLLNWRNGHPSFFLNVFHPEYDNLFIAGLIQPDSGQFGLVDRQCQLIARFILCQQRNPAKAAYFRALKQRGQEDYGGGVKYKESSRHYVEIEHYSYRKRLEQLIEQMKG